MYPLEVLMGENHGNSKLTNCDVIKIRELYDNKTMQTKKIAEIFNVDPSCIYLIGKRKNWKHL